MPRRPFVGVDADPEAIAWAKAHIRHEGDRVSFVSLDAFEAADPPAQFDLIVCSRLSSTSPAPRPSCETSGATWPTTASRSSLLRTGPPPSVGRRCSARSSTSRNSCPRSSTGCSTGQGTSSPGSSWSAAVDCIDVAWLWFRRETAREVGTGPENESRQQRGPLPSTGSAPRASSRSSRKPSAGRSTTSTGRVTGRSGRRPGLRPAGPLDDDRRRYEGAFVVPGHRPRLTRGPPTATASA